MSDSLERLLDRAVAGCYKTIFWPVPYPRTIPRIGQKRGPLPDPGKKWTRNYEKLVRHLKRKEPVGWPIGEHSIIEMEEHFARGLKKDQRVDLIVAKLDCYIAAWKNSIRNASPRLQDGAQAFLELWCRVEVECTPWCLICREKTDKRWRLLQGLPKP